MVDHQYSKRFKKSTDINFKNDEFERKFAQWLVGFIQCYPHLIEKREFDNDSEDWVFKFWVEDADREKMLNELKGVAGVSETP